jgi:hypothetical protein
MIMKKWTAPLVAATLLFSTVTPAIAEGNDKVKVKSVEFFGMEAPQTLEQKNNLMYSTASVEITYNDNNKQTFPLSYETLYRPGDTIGGKTTGVTTYANGNVVTKSNGTPYVSSAPYMNSLIHVPGMPYNT